MKNRYGLAALTLALPLLLLTGCGDDDDGNGPDLTLALVAGNWTAISVDFESDTDPLDTVDIISDLNGTFDITIEENGDYVTSLALPGEGTSVETGVVSVVNGDQLRFDPDDDAAEVAEARLSDSSNRLTLEFENAEYDFDGNGTDEDANAQMILVRL